MTFVLTRLVSIALESEGYYYTRCGEFQRLAPGYDRFFRYLRTGNK